MSWVNDVNALFERQSPNEMNDVAIAALTKTALLFSVRKGRTKADSERAALSAAKRGAGFPTAAHDAIREIRRQKAIANRIAEAAKPRKARTGQKLSDAQVSDLRARLDRGEKQKDIALMFGISRSLVSAINLGLQYNKAAAK